MVVFVMVRVDGLRWKASLVSVGLGLVSMPYWRKSKTAYEALTSVARGKSGGPLIPFEESEALTHRFTIEGALLEAIATLI